MKNLKKSLKKIIQKIYRVKYSESNNGQIIDF
jgi:hypothetical protein